MKSKVLQWTAILLILVTGYLHFIAAPGEYSQSRYIGVLFLLNFFGTLFSAIGIFRGRFWWGWALGVFITMGSIFAYIQSRTIGIPGIKVQEWFDPIGISAVSVEITFLIVFALAKPWATAVSDSSPATREARQRQLISVGAAIFALIAVSDILFRMGVGTAPLERNDAIPETVISAQALEEQYGIRLSLVAVTAAGGIVEVSYRVIDPLKAVKLIKQESVGIMPMVYVENRRVMLMPNSTMRAPQLIAGRVYYMLLPNTQNAVTRGTLVTVVFGDVALEPIAAK